MKTMKKLFASLLVLCMVLVMPNMSTFASTTGTEENPEVIEILGGTATQAEGVKGYYYSYTATEDGMFTFGEVTSDVVCGEEEFLDVYGEVTNTETGETSRESVFAFAGDELVIWVYAQVYYYDADLNYAPVYSYPATDIEWEATIAPAESLEWGTGTTATVEEKHSKALYYLYEAPETLVGINELVLTVSDVLLTQENEEITDIYYMVRLENLTTGEVVSA